MDAHTFIRCWLWRPFVPAEFGKPESVIEKKGKGFVYDPYDDFAKHWHKRIEKHYGVEIKEEEVREMLEKALIRDEQAHCSLMDPEAIYYVLLDMKILLSTMKSPPPEGVEMDNLMFIPVKIWVMSHNCLVVHLLELKAREKYLEKYMDEIIGARSIEEDIYKKVEVELGERKAEEEKEEKESFWSRIKPKYYSKGDPLNAWDDKKNPYEFVPNRFMRFVRFFVKGGPYEPVFKERASKMYMRASAFYFRQVVDMLQQTMGIE
jgi:hypothetical protein